MCLNTLDMLFFKLFVQENIGLLYTLLFFVHGSANSSKDKGSHRFLIQLTSFTLGFSSVSWLIVVDVISLVVLRNSSVHS